MADTVAAAVDDSLEWTKESRLEQVNIECCSHLTLATMNRIKELALERQAELIRQGRTKGRIWAENEHVMMMTRLAMERGPELPAERLRTSIITTPPDSNASSSSSISTDNGSEPEVGASLDGSHQSIQGQPPQAPLQEQSQEHPQEHPQQGQLQEQQPESNLQQLSQEDESMMSLIEAEAMA
jgi:hypothetical protein